MDARYIAEEVVKLFVGPFVTGEPREKAVEAVKNLMETYYYQQLFDREAMEEKIKDLKREFDLRGERILWLERALESKR